MHISKVSKSFNEEVSFLFNDDTGDMYLLTYLKPNNKMSLHEIAFTISF